MISSSNKKEGIVKLDKESPEYRKVQYDLYHTDLELKCPICGQPVINLSLLGEHMRDLHKNSYRQLQYMKKKACVIYSRRCHNKFDKQVIDDIESEISKKLDDDFRKNKSNKIGKPRKPGEPKKLPWPKMKGGTGTLRAWDALSKCSNPIIFSSTR